MRTLILMRHAKSSFKDTSLKDGKRPLSKRGQRNAAQMAELIKEREMYPEVILASSAVRACQTAQIVAQGTGFPGEVRFLDSLFMAEADEILDVLHEIPGEVQSVMVIGHNPGLESMIPMLTRKVAALPTAGIAYLALPIDDWIALKKKTKADLIELWRPKDLEK
jgi:phosphohistidine phosphatase